MPAQLKRMVSSTCNRFFAVMYGVTWETLHIMSALEDFVGNWRDILILYKNIQCFLQF